MASKGADNTDISKTVEIPFAKQDVGPDVETSLDQQVDQGNIADDTTEPNHEVHISEDNEMSPTKEAKDTTTKSQEVVSDSDGEQTIDKEDGVVDLDDVSSDLNQTVADTYKGNSMAKRLRSSSGKVVPTATKTPITRMKSTVVGPKKRWSKVTPKATIGKKGKKRKAAESSDSENAHVEEDVSPIPVSVTKKSTGKKTSTNASVVLTDNISFHYPNYANRGKYVFHRRLALERELGPDILEINVVVDLIKNAGLESTVTNLGSCYEKLVKEFLVNIPNDCDNPVSPNYHVVYVRGKEVKFSPTIINRFLGIDESQCADTELNSNQVCKVITANQVRVWPKKGKIPAVMLSVKYIILNRIGAANWVPTTHSSDIATNMVKLIYSIGTKTKMNIGAFIFELTLRNGRSEALKLPISFPTLTSADMPKKRESPLSLHFKLFESHHVADLVGASAPTSIPTAGTGSMSRKDIVVGLKDTCKYLEERKAMFERMILALESEDVGVGNKEAGMEVVNDSVAEEYAADAGAEEEEEDGEEEEDMETDA
jgi:hypothetical protein